MIDRFIVKVNAEAFSDKVWQSPDTFTADELNAVVRNWAEMVNDILVCLSDGKSTQEIIEKLDGDYYPLGDLVNFLESIELQLEG